MSIVTVFECSACRFGVCSNGDHQRISASISDGTYGKPAIPEAEQGMSGGREPQPGDGPDYHADHAAWARRESIRSTSTERES